VTPELREVAQLLVDQYGWSALDDRVRIVEWLEDRGLLSPRTHAPTQADTDAIDAVESHIRWLLS
jgi:hypothetical protein